MEEMYKDINNFVYRIMFTKYFLSVFKHICQQYNTTNSNKDHFEIQMIQFTHPSTLLLYGGGCEEDEE